ncbi:MAG: hypothetical protein FRX49_01836 [Trebouxia sp. A1-2]|nr:MAG: hypothetical protein FRX49_01836 [Trebouxia sp. A1-2]
MSSLHKVSSAEKSDQNQSLAEEVLHSSVSQYGSVDTVCKVACEFVGYQTPGWVVAIYIALVIMTGGLAWRMLDGHRKLVKVFQHTHVPNATQRLGKSQQPAQRFLVLNLLVYIYDAQDDKFKQLPDMPWDIPQQILDANEALQRVTAGGDWSTFNALSIWPRRDRASLYGSNDVAAGRPNLLRMAAAYLCQPIFIVQFAELIFITYEQDYKLAGLLLSVTITSCFVSVYRLYQSRMGLYQSVSQQRLVAVVQAGRVRAVSSRRLVPGDVVVLLAGKATCDMVLLRGSCLVEESLLSGEAAQVRKSSIGGMGLGQYHPNTHHAYTVHSGTNVEQVWNEEDAEDEVLAMVVRTGLCTSMGSMMRQVVYNAMPTRNRLLREYHVEEQTILQLHSFRDYFIFCAGCLVLQFAHFSLFIAKAKKYEDDPVDAFQRVVDNFIASWPMTTPTVLILALAVRIVNLKQKGIETLQPDKLQAAANTEIVCFDKTGTLTTNSSDLHGVIPVVGGQFLSLQSDAIRWPNGLKQAAAVCNSLTLISKSKVVGELGERRAFNAVEARFVERNVVTLPLQTTHGRQDRQATFHILKRFEFESSHMRSGVVAVEHHKGKHVTDGSLIIRGAAAVIERMIDKDVLPPKYRQLVDEWSAQSYRVLAVAMAQVPNVAKLDLASMSQQQVEDQAGPFELLGLGILSNHLNSDSKATGWFEAGDGNWRLLIYCFGSGERSEYSLVQASAACSGTHAYMLNTVYLWKTVFAVHVGMVPKESRVVVIQTHAEHRGSSAIAARHKPNLPDVPETPKSQQRHIARVVSFAEPNARSDSSDDMRSLGGFSESQPEPDKSQKDWLKPQDIYPISPSQSQSPLLGTQSYQAWSLQARAEPLLSPELAQLSPSQSFASFSGRLQSKSLPSTAASAPQCFAVRGEDDSLQSTAEAAREGLSFVLDNGDTFEEGDTLRAFNTISQGSMQCCITGPAFEYLLQQPNQALVQAVMLNSVAFTRMRSHQKGQLMDLLGRKGLHQMLNGQRQHILGLGKSCLYCGDGINDLEALANANVGMAVGSAEASAAATFCDTHYSIAGQQFMALYQLADTASVDVTFFLDGSNYSNNQSDAFDFIALAVGIAAIFRPAASVLYPTRRLPRICGAYNWFALMFSALMTGVMYVAILSLLDQQAWYTGGNGKDAQNPVITVAWCICLVQIIVPAVMFLFECYPYCKKANKAEMVLVGALLVYMTLCCSLGPGFYDAINIFGFYGLPFSFASKLEVLCLVFSVGYVVVLVKARQLFAWYEARRIVSFPHSSC